MRSIQKRYCVFGCDVLYERCVPLHRFPHPEKRSEMFAAWMSIVGGKLRETNTAKIYQGKRVCDQHFEPDQKLSNSRLIWSAVPTINLKRVRQSIATIVDTDHPYCHPRREWEHLPLMTSSTVKSTMYPIRSASTSTTANTGEGTANEMNENTTVAIDDPCDDSDNDDVVSNKPVPESEELPRELFSWEKTDTIVADDTMVVSDLDMEAPELTTLNFGDVSMYNDEQPSKAGHVGNQCSDYTCNQCGETITGFRYTCVQCADWDLCAACEARAAHDTHYVLRVPGQRPYKEIQAVLAAIRHQMLREDLFLPEIITSVKEEVKDEDAEVPAGAPDVEADPLAAWDISQLEDDCDALEIYPEREDEVVCPPRKRRRNSLDSSAHTQNFTPCDDSSSYDKLATVTSDILMESNKDDTRSDDSQTCNPKFDCYEPIEIIDIDKLIKTQEQTEQHCKRNVNDTTQITKESCTEMSLDRYVSPRDGTLDTCKFKLQHNKREKLVDMSSSKTPLRTFKLTSHTQDDTNSGRIGARKKEMETDGKGVVTRNEGIATLSQTRKGTDSKGIGTRSVANTINRTKKRYKILLPPGAQWKQLLMTMLKSKVTVQLVDVMQIIRKMRMHKKTEIKEI